MPNDADGKKDVLLTFDDSATGQHSFKNPRLCSYKASNDRHALLPILVHAIVPFVVLWKSVSWLDTAAHFAESCSDAKPLFHDLCGLLGRIRILLVPCRRSQD